MGRAKKTRKFAEVKRMISPKDPRLAAGKKEQKPKAQTTKNGELIRHV